MNGFALKCIALLAMLIDHTGAILFPQYLWLRIIGRLAFPIYCYLLIEGYVHTKSIKKYLLRLGLFAFISEIPFDLAFHSGSFVSGSNVFFTLFLGLLAVYVCDRLKLKYPDKPYIGYSMFLIAAVLAVFMATDYDFYGIALIAVIYIFRQKKTAQIILTAFIFSMINWIQMYGVLAYIPICLYNGRRGPNSKLLSSLFYWFYPLHILVLYVISTRI